MSESDTARAALLERMARAIEATIRYAVEPDARANQMTPDELAMLSSAALNIALEEAARVAETCHVGWPMDGREQRNVCARAIRALKSGGAEPPRKDG